MPAYDMRQRHTHTECRKKKRISRGHTLSLTALFSSLSHTTRWSTGDTPGIRRELRKVKERERETFETEKVPTARERHTRDSPFSFLVLSSSFHAFARTRSADLRVEVRREKGENTARLDSASRFESGMILSRRGEDGLLQSVSQSESTVVSIFK